LNSLEKTDQTISSPSRVQTAVLSFNQVIQKALSIPSYQRGFVWEPEKVTELAGDLIAYAKSNQATPYYMGTLLLHHRQEGETQSGTKELIDGQQRITALCLLYRHWMQRLPLGQQLTYSPASRVAIRKAWQAISAKVSTNIEADVKHLFDRIQFTLIEVQDLDLAFTFFDTQNNRGVPLHATDLLKAYHLRQIRSHDSQQKQDFEALQRNCSERWVNIQNQNTILSTEKDFSHSLFQNFLWRGRRWRGKSADFPKHNSLLTEFQINTRQCDYSNEGGSLNIPLFPSRHNRLSSTFHISSDSKCHMEGAPIPVSPNAAELPFSLRQPLYDGAAFFLYTDKYASMLQELMKRGNSSIEVKAFRHIDAELIQHTSPYLRQVFLLSALLYVDKFGHDQLAAFGQKLAFLLGYIRMKWSRIVYQTANNFLRGKLENLGDQNLLDVLCQSFDAEEFNGYLHKLCTNKKISHYLSAESSNRETLTPSRKRYRKRARAFYEKASQTQGTSAEGVIHEKAFAE